MNPPVWTKEQLETDGITAGQRFAEGRHTEQLEVYLALFDDYVGIVEEVMEETVDLRHLSESTVALMADPKKREVFRYLSGPPVSEDDLKVLMEAKSIAPAKIASDAALRAKVVAFMRNWHDRRRFPWLSDNTEPSEADRRVGIIATTALLAMRRVETLRRHEGKSLQEERVELQLLRVGYTKVKTRTIKTLSDAPKRGEFCRESMLGGRKADFVIGLYDGRVLGLECKVSNSGTNSVKRLNNDAAVKAELWRKEFGTVQIVPGAVLSGVYALVNLTQAQDRGLFLFWAHDLPRMTDWMASLDTPPTATARSEGLDR